MTIQIKTHNCMKKRMKKIMVKNFFCHNNLMIIFVRKKTILCRTKKAFMKFSMASIDIFRYREDAQYGYYADRSLIKSEYLCRSFWLFWLQEFHVRNIIHSWDFAGKEMPWRSSKNFTNKLKFENSFTQIKFQ